MKAVITALVFFSASLALAKQVAIDKSASSLQWVGQKKFTEDGHKGTVKLKKGTVNLDEKNNLVGGTLVIDMTSIEDLDLSGKWKKKLEDHLNSEDFFDVKKHPEASFKITKVEPTRSDIHKVTGNLTLRGQTHPETFEIKINRKKDVLVGTGEMEFNRNKYGVTYNSEANILKKGIKIAKDKIIKDVIRLSIELQTQKI